MKIGLFAALVTPYAAPETAVALAREAEARGFDSLWVGEHVALFDDYDSAYPYSPDGTLPAPADIGMPDPFVFLSHLAAVTSRIRLGTAICILPQRNPVYVAKEAATLDWLSGGRFDLGVGVGWLREEYEALGVPFARRGARCDDYLAVLRTCWVDEVSAHDGEFHTLPPCRVNPKPVQSPHVPVHIGGESDPALRRVARHGQGWHGMGMTPEQAAERIARLTELLAEHDRARDEVQVTVSPYMLPVDPEAIRGYAEAGADQVTLVAFASSPEEVPAALDAHRGCLDAAAALR